MSAAGAIERGAAQKLGELQSLSELLQRRELRAVCELGTLAGGTFWLLAYLARADALLVSVDLPGGPFSGDTPPASEQELRELCLPLQRVEIIRGDSQRLGTRGRVARILAELGLELDLLFIDADHSYDGVRRDFVLYGPLVRAGGLVVFHDICEHAPELGVGVGRFWRQLDGQKIELVEEPRTWGGIGVWEKPA